LSNNNFTGPFPIFLGKLRYLGKLLSFGIHAIIKSLFILFRIFLVSTFIHNTQLTGSIPQSFCEPDKNVQAVIILDCNATHVPARNCTCCDNLTFCADKLPPSLQELV
jgi:hypothetical protein